MSSVLRTGGPPSAGRHHRLSVGDALPVVEAKAAGGGGVVMPHRLFGEGRGVLLSLPQAFDPVASTEIARLDALGDELAKLGVRAAAIVSEDLNTCQRWMQDVRAVTSRLPTLPVLADENGDLACRLGLTSLTDERRSKLDRRPVIAHAIIVVSPPRDPLSLADSDPDCEYVAEGEGAGIDHRATGRTAPVSSEAHAVVRSVDGDDAPVPTLCKRRFVRSVEALFEAPQMCGFSYDELLRTLDAIRVHERSAGALVTPADWEPGADALVCGSLTEDQAKRRVPLGYHVLEVPSGKPFLRVTPDQQPAVIDSSDPRDEGDTLPFA